MAGKVIGEGIKTCWIVLDVLKNDSLVDSDLDDGKSHMVVQKHIEYLGCFVYMTRELYSKKGLVSKYGMSF
jgi:hypothetical protein